VGKHGASPIVFTDLFRDRFTRPHDSGIRARFSAAPAIVTLAAPLSSDSFTRDPAGR